jgi:mRNA interferase MazF
MDRPDTAEFPRLLAIGDVVVASFPLHDPHGHEQEGTRPAVVVGLPELVGEPRFPIVFLAPFTSDRGQSWADRSPNLYPRFPGGTVDLPAASICLLDQTRAVDIRRVVEYRGRLDDALYRPIGEGLMRLFGDRLDF